MIRVVFSTAAAAFCATAGFPQTPWNTGGFEMPESALYDAGANHVILSNIKGHPGEADGDGYLSLLAPDGTVLDPAWVTGLDAPKGMARAGDALLVADLTNLRVIDAQSGALRRTIPVDGAQFLNDITSDGQTAWITDFMAHTIWHYADGEVTRWLHDPALSHPNGILFDDGRLVVGSWGAGLREDFSTETPGSLLSIDLESQQISVVAAGLGNLDGVVRLGDELLVNDWITGDVFAVASDGSARTILRLPKGLADISAHGDQLYLPLMLDGQLQALRF